MSQGFKVMWEEKSACLHVFISIDISDKGTWSIHAGFYHKHYKLWTCTKWQIEVETCWGRLRLFSLAMFTGFGKKYVLLKSFTTSYYRIVFSKTTLNVVYVY